MPKKENLQLFLIAVGIIGGMATAYLGYRSYQLAKQEHELKKEEHELSTSLLASQNEAAKLQLEKLKLEKQDKEAA